MSIGLRDNIEAVVRFFVEFSVRRVAETLWQLRLLGRVPSRRQLVVIMRRGIYRPD